MNYVFITVFNFERILRKDVVNNKRNFKGDLFGRRSIDKFFSKYEKNFLLAFKEYINNPEKFFDELFIPAQITERNYIKEDIFPAYHKKQDCVRLLSDYDNIKFPECIIKLGEEAKTTTRELYYKNSEHYTKYPDRFLVDLGGKFPKLIDELKLIAPNTLIVHHDNTSFKEDENISKSEMENQIDTLISSAEAYYQSCLMNKVILSHLAQYSYQAYKGQAFNDRGVWSNKTEIHTVLCEFHIKYKYPLEKKLKKYYAFTLGRTVQADVKYLDELNFKPCSTCCKNTLIGL